VAADDEKFLVKNFSLPLTLAQNKHFRGARAAGLTKHRGIEIRSARSIK